MSVWLTADTHFCHANILKFCQRPFKDVTEMDLQMITRWNAVVGPADVVYHLGDLALCGDDDTFSTGFKAKNVNGKVVQGVVCSGLIFKNSTIRW